MAKGTKNASKKSTPQLNAVPLEKAIGFLQLHDYVEKIYINKHGEYHLQAVDGFEEYDASTLLSMGGLSGGDGDENDDDLVDYVLTEDDFAANPDFEKQGLKVGDTIQIPAK
jgi:hypothetical protein